jgi:hypothetical protein
MGCDIHGWIDVRYYPGNIKSPPRPMINVSNLMSRHYGIFSYLFGVRGEDKDIPALFPDRGLPDDFCGNSNITDFETAILKEAIGPDYHSHTWMTLEEFMAIDFHQKTPYQSQINPRKKATIRELLTADPDWNTMWALFKTLALSYDPKSIRLVVWFDN